MRLGRVSTGGCDEMSTGVEPVDDEDEDGMGDMEREDGPESLNREAANSMAEEAGGSPAAPPPPLLLLLLVVVVVPVASGDDP